MHTFLTMLLMKPIFYDFNVVDEDADDINMNDDDDVDDAGENRDGFDEDSAANLYPGAAFPSRDVRRLLRASGHLRGDLGENLA